MKYLYLGTYLYGIMLLYFNIYSKWFVGTINFVFDPSSYFVNDIPSVFYEGIYLRNPFDDPTGGGNRPVPANNSKNYDSRNNNGR